MTRGQAAEAAKVYLATGDPGAVIVDDGAFEDPGGWAFLCRGRGEPRLGGLCAVYVPADGSSVRGFGSGTWFTVFQTRWGPEPLALCTEAGRLTAPLVGALAAQGVDLEEIVAARVLLASKFTEEILAVRPGGDAASIAGRLVQAGFPVFTRPLPGR